jgi:hypothetical protein
MLALPSLFEFRDDIDPRFNTGQSISIKQGESDSVWRYQYPGGDTSARDAVRDDIVKTLSSMSSPLTHELIVARIQALSCAGCHHLNNDKPDLGLTHKAWPASLGFEHVTEEMPDQDTDGPRYRISPALKTFLERRKQVLGNMLTR